MAFYQADVIFPADRAPIRNGIVEVDDSGRILSLSHTPPPSAHVQQLKGALVPGFINTHCHLELSHLRGRIDTGTGLLPFLRAVVSLREVDPLDIQAAIIKADQDMWQNGIQAVGDISNTVDTVAVKSTSSIAYYTFVEIFDFLQGGPMAQQVFAKAQETYSEHQEPKRLVPHAPYTVSPELHAAIAEHNLVGGTVSIHNQETIAEDELFLSKTGAFMEFYRDFNFPLDRFTAFAKTSLASTLDYLNPERRNLFVHNTQTSLLDLELAQEWSEKTYWATCPNANLYIENRLPNYHTFVEAGATMTIGTDSLSSNWQLSIIEEMKTIQKYQSSLDTRTLVQWATINGAEALGFDARLGSLSPGKVPGLLHLKNLDEQFRLTPKSTAKRLA